MGAIRKLSVIILTLLIAVSCEPGNTVRIENFSPAGEVGRLTNFVIEFSEDLAPPDVQDKWLDEQFVEFSPEIDGKFKWTSGSTLVFSPDSPLEPIQSYSAKVTEKVLFDAKYSPDFETYEFHTPDFDVVKVDFFWTNIPHQNYKLSVKANIHFNYPVKPEELKDYLKVSREGEPVPGFNIVTEDEAEVVAINFGEMKQPDKEEKFSIVVKKGLKSILNKKGLFEDRKFEATLPPVTRLAITGVSSGFDGNTGWIEVSTTQTVDESKLKDYVTTEPEKRLQFFVNENQFRIETDLSDVRTVELIIKKGLPGLYGGELEDDFVETVSMVNVKPSISFADRKGKYLMLSGEKNLQVNAVNIDEVEIEVSEVFENNLLHFLNQYSYYYDYYDEWYTPAYYVSNYGKSIYTEKLKLDESKNWLQSFNVNLSNALNQKYKGVYVVKVRSADDRWISASKMIALSDLGIIAKASKDQIMVFVNSIKTALAIDNAEVSVISGNNQTLLSGKTNSEGVVTFEDVSGQIEGFTPRLIVVKHNGDFNYIDLRETRIETSRFDVGGQTQFNENFNTFIYSARNLYRPGESVNLSAIVRGDKMDVVQDIPVLIKIISPTGKTFDEFKKELNKEGSFDIEFNVPDYAQTGEYVAELYTGSEQLIGNYRFSVEEFVPDKIRVTLNSDKESLMPGEVVSVDVDAEFLFGAKAANLRYEADIILTHRPFKSKTFPRFDFTNSSITASSFENTLLEGKLNEQGQTTIKYKVPDWVNGPGIVKGTAYVSVFDLTGRTVVRAASFNIFPKNYFIGINAPGYYFGTNEQLKFKVAAVDKNDKPVKNFKAAVELIRYEWQTVLKKNYSGQYYYASEQKPVVEWKKNYTFDSNPKDIQFAVTKSGKYEFRVYKQGSKDYNRKTFYAYGWGSSTASSFEVDKEGRVEIVFDTEEYEPGENAKILFTTPFSGKMLVTVERNKVIEYEYLKVENKSAELEIKLNDDFMPNVYVTATLFKEHSPEKTSPFLVGHGFASMKVVKKKNHLSVTITAQEKVKPLTTQEITIKTEPLKDIYVTLAAVDEGILQIKNYRTPDPYSFMYAKKSLRVDSYDLYKLLLPEIVSTSSSPGGDQMSEQLRKRTNPIKANRFKLISYWSGIKKTNSSGVVKVKLNIPQFNGDIRLMAVVYTGKRFGAAEEHIKVADDIILEPQIPRFLSINDSLTAPVAVINTTSKEKKVTVSLKVEGPLSVTSAKQKSVTVAPNSTGQVVFNITALPQTGKGKIVFETSGAATVKEEIEISVGPVSPLVVETGSGTIKAGEKINLRIPSSFLEGTQHTTVTISKFPAVKFAKHLKYLVGYPHGCLEQTISKLFPQLYFEELAKLVAPEYYKTTNPVYYVKEGIRKIESMQMYDGSLAFWHGGTYSNWWGSVYAAHFLVEAQKNGFNVSKNVLDKLLSHISKKAKNHEAYSYVTYSGTRRTYKNIAKKEIIYSLYVLALAGKGDIATMNYYKARPHLITGDTRYLLAGAYALMGKWNSYYEIVPNSFNPVHPQQESGGSFDSDVRANAIMLNVLLEVEPASAQIPYMIKYLTQKSDDVYSTQQRAFLFLALGKAAKLNADADVDIEIKSGNALITKFTGKDLTITDDKLNSGNVSLAASGSGEVYYFWSSEGIKVNEKVKETDSFMKVRRTYYSYKTGDEITDNNFTQGDLIVCKISLTGFERSADNIVITDMIPSGFEIENPRLNASTELQWKPRIPINVEYMDIRDDRLLLFTKLKRRTTNEFYYLLRVVNQGRFELPVISAESMYDREFHSFNGAGKVNVWER